MRSRSITIALTRLGSHHRADAAARGEARRAAVLVAEGDARDQALILADRAAKPEGHLLPVPGVQHLRRLEVPLAEIRRGVIEVDGPVLPEMEDHPLRCRAVQREAGDPQLAQAVAERAAAVRLLDASRQRALAADARAVGVREGGAGERAGREDQRIGRGQRVDRRGTELQQGLRDEVPAGPDVVFALDVPLGDRAIGQVDIVVDAHRRLLVTPLG